MHVCSLFFSLKLFLQDGEDFSCQAGLTCVLTKKFKVLGEITPVKQCMPKDMAIEVETVDMEEDKQTALARMKRFIPLAVRKLDIFNKLDLKRESHLAIQRNKQDNRKVLLSSFHLNGYTKGLYPQTQEIDHLVQQNKQYHRKVLLSSFHLNGHT